MTDLFQAGNRTIDPREFPALLRRYQIMPQFLRGIILDEAIAKYEGTAEERAAAVEQFCQQNQMTSPEAKAAWLKSQHMSEAEMEDLAVRPAAIARFKAAKFGPRVQSHFMARKSSLDRVVYSLIRTRDEGLAHELYYRILEGEQSFAECAAQFSEGPEARTGGKLGPAPLNQPHPAISQLLSVSQPGQLWSPRRLAEWSILIRLEQFFPAQLDDAMRSHLTDELFENWLNQQLQQMGPLVLKSDASETFDEPPELPSETPDPVELPVEN